MADRIGEVLGGVVDPRIVRAVVDLTGGDLDAVTAVVQDAKETGCLERGADAWHLSAPLPTRSLVQAAAIRLQDLAPPVRSAARLLALGSPLSLGLAGRLLEPRAVRELEGRGVARFRRRGGGQELLIRDRVHRTAVLDGLAGPERCALISRLAGALDGPDADDETHLRVARWRLDVGGWSAARFEAAAHLAYVRSETLLAERLASRAVELGGGCAVAVVRAVSTTARGGGDELRGLRAEAASLAQGERDRARLALIDAHRHAVGEGDWERGADHLDLARAPMSTSAPAQQLQAYAGLLRALDADVADPDPLEPSPSGVDPEAEVVREVAAVVAAGFRLDRPRLKQAAAVVAERCRSGAQVPLAGDLAAGLHLLDADPRPLPDRRVSAMARLEEALAGPDPRIAWWSAVVGRIELAAGDLQGARSRFVEADLAAGTCDPLRLRPRLWTDLALVAALGGVPAEAGRWLQDLAEERRRSIAIDVRCALVEIVIAAQYEGPTEATRLAVAAGDRNAADGRWRDAVLAWHLAIRLGHAGAVVDRLSNPLLPDHPAVGTARRHGETLVAGDAAGLVTVAKEMAAAGRYLVAAETAAQAARLDGDPVAWALAGGLAAACAEVRYPTLDDVSRACLSPRRQEVARAAMTGASAPRIAAVLGLSERTVNNHLARVYRDLGVRGRAELTSVYRADRRPLTVTV